MPVSRMRMRQWLEDRLESKAIAGLVWLDKEMKIFSIPWKHAARHGWEMEKDACLFKQWAIHTGKFKAGVSHPDPKTWKANFRCALNSLPDIIEVKDKSVNKGCGAVRVYRMLQNDSKKGKRSKTKVGKPKSRCKASDLNEEVPNWSEGSLSPDPSTLSPQNVESMAEVGNSKLSELEVSSSQYSTDEESQANSNCVVRDRIDSCSLFQWSPGHPADFDDEIPIELFATAEELERDPLQWIPIDIFSNRSSLQSNVVDTTDTSDSLLDNGSHTSGLEIEARFYTELRGLTGSEDSLGLFEPWPISSLLHHIG